MCKAHFIRAAYFICRWHISLVPQGTNFIAKRTSFRMSFLLVEHRRFELLTSTLRTLRATNCANAPRTENIIHAFRKNASGFFKKVFADRKYILLFQKVCCKIAKVQQSHRAEMAELGLRRTTGNRVYQEWYRGFESLSLRQKGIAILTKIATPFYVLREGVYS